MILRRVQLEARLLQNELIAAIRHAEFERTCHSLPESVFTFERFRRTGHAQVRKLCSEDSIPDRGRGGTALPH